MKLMKITNTLTMVDEEHVGGFLLEKDPATYTPKLWEYICKKFNIESVLDVGCGMGYAIEEFLKHCNSVTGIDGSRYVIENSHLFNNIVYHDFSTGPLKMNSSYDLCWSCEFVEHVDEEYRDNFLEAFAHSKFLAITYAEPGQPGHHHVNCQPKQYWIDHLKRYGFIYNEVVTNELKEIAYKDALELNPQYNDNHFYNRGLFFEKKSNNTRMSFKNNKIIFT
jgi:SAM-dependent methyltransferase